MKNSEYVRNIRIVPKNPDSDTFVWGVDLAIPHKNICGHVHYTHISQNGEAETFLAAYNEMLEYIERPIYR